MMAPPLAAELAVSDTFVYTSDSSSAKIAPPLTGDIVVPLVRLMSENETVNFPAPFTLKIDPLLIPLTVTPAAGPTRSRLSVMPRGDEVNVIVLLASKTLG